MASVSRICILVLFLLSCKCGISSCSKHDAQLWEVEEQPVNLHEHILSLRNELHQERMERIEKIEVLNQAISRFERRNEGNDEERNGRHNFNNSMGFELGILESVRREFEREKALRIQAQRHVDVLKEHVDALGNRLQLFEDKTCNSQVAFHARLTSTLSTFFHGQTIIFDDVYLNLGNGYVQNTGVFRAPVAGLYIVMVTISSAHIIAPDVEVVRNGTPLCRLAAASIWVGSPCNAIVHLHHGDAIWARVFYVHPVDRLRGEMFSTFSMVLVSRK